MYNGYSINGDLQTGIWDVGGVKLGTLAGAALGALFLHN